jgi:hypothetical protein
MSEQMSKEVVAFERISGRDDSGGRPGAHQQFIGDAIVGFARRSINPIGVAPSRRR